MKTADTEADDRKAQRRQTFLKKVQDEQMASGGSGRSLSAFGRKLEDVAAEKVRRVEDLKPEPGRGIKQDEAQKSDERQQAQTRAARFRAALENTLQIEALQQRRDEELKQRQEAEQQAELRAVQLREERRRSAQTEAEQSQRDEELKQRQEAEREAKQQAEKRAEARAARFREERQRIQEAQAAEAQRQRELEEAALRRQEAEQREAAREARLREAERGTSEDSAQAEKEKALQAAALQKREAERQAEARVAQQREEQQELQDRDVEIRRDEEAQVAALRLQKHEQRLAARNENAGVFEEEPRQSQFAAAGRSEIQTAESAVQSAAQNKARQAQTARNRTRLALRASGRASMRMASTPGPTVPPVVLYLSTSKNLIVDENNRPVNLRGVTVRGFDTVAPASGEAFPAALALDDNSLLELTSRWGANLVRLPFQAQTILSGNGSVTAAAVLSGLDAIVAAITEAGAYVLLAMEPTPGSGASPAPDASSTQAWQLLAARYNTEPRVLFEIYASASALAENWLQSALTLVNAIRQKNPSALIFMGSGRGGADLTGLPLISSAGDPLPNMVYTMAVSTSSSLSPDDGAFRALTESQPVFVSMWSDDGSDLDRLSSHEADLFERFGVGWAAANWNADPLLVADAGSEDFTPTGWGQVAQRALAQSALNAFQPASDISQSIFTTRGPALHELKVRGSFIVDENDQPVNLRGVTIQGLDSVAPVSGQSFPAALSLDDNNLLEIRETWGANLVRLPFQSQTILAGSATLPVAALLAGLDATVSAITEAGAYVLLALQPPAGSGSPSAPDPQVAQVWQVLAERYQNVSGILFEIYSSATPLTGNWLQLASTLVGTIRQRKPGALIFLGSGNGGPSVKGLPLLSPTGAPVFNLVYTIAASPGNIPSSDDGNLSALANSNPVFVSLWSDDGSDLGRSSGRIADLFDRYGMGFAAASWNADPRLVADAAGHDFTATGWGLTAGRALRSPGRPLLKPFSSATQK